MNTIMFNKRLLTLRQASETLSLSVNTLRNLIASGKLAAIRSNPRGKLLLDPRELESFCQRNTRTPDAHQGEVKS